MRDSAWRSRNQCSPKSELKSPNVFKFDNTVLQNMDVCPQTTRLLE